MEFLLSSPEYPIKNIDDKGLPVYEKNPSESEKYRAQIYPLISDGAVAFAQDVKSIFGDYDIFLDGDGLVKYINNYIVHPSARDVEEMANIKFAYDSNHTQYIPLFSDKISLFDVFRHPKKTIKILKRLYWRTPLQSFLICLLKPISIKTKGFRQVKIIFFPYLKHQYVQVSFYINAKWHYKFIIGNRLEDYHDKR